ncbi:MAG: MerR family transcriptional regulator [Desulfobaccales bacterium]
MMENKFDQGQVNKRFAHIPGRTIRFWVENGLIETVGETTDGRGLHRLYDTRALYQIAVAERLLRLGVSLRVVREYLRNNFHGLMPTPEITGRDADGWGYEPGDKLSEEAGQRKTDVAMKKNLTILCDFSGREMRRTLILLPQGTQFDKGNEIVIQIFLPQTKETVDAMIQACTQE